MAEGIADQGPTTNEVKEIPFARPSAEILRVPIERPAVRGLSEQDTKVKSEMEDKLAPKPLSSEDIRSGAQGKVYEVIQRLDELQEKRGASASAEEAYQRFLDMNQGTIKELYRHAYNFSPNYRQMMKREAVRHGIDLSGPPPKESVTSENLLEGYSRGNNELDSNRLVSSLKKWGGKLRFFRGMTREK